MTPRVAWVLGVVLITAVVAAVAWYFFKPTHLVEVDVDSITAGTPTASGIPTEIKGDIIEGGDISTFKPSFPFTEFRDARSYAKGSAFDLIVRGKLPNGTYVVSVKNSHGSILLPLEKKAPDFYVSPPIVILSREASSAYFLGYYILRQDAGTSDKLDLKVERVLPGYK